MKQFKWEQGDNMNMQLGKRRGSVIVEFAIVAPMLILISLMLVQFALFANANISLSQIAREGARAAAVGSNDDSKITAIVNSTANKVGIRSTNITTTISPVQAQRLPGTTVTVAISYNMENRRILPKKVFGVQILPQTVTRTADMRVEGIS